MDATAQQQARPEQGAGGPGWRTAVRVVIAVAWVLAPPAALLAGVGETLAFFGEQPSAAEKEAAARWWTRGAAAAGLLPLAGLALCATTHQRLRWGAALLVGAVAGAVLLSWAAAVRPPAPPAPRPPVGCVERSGGEATCPGG